MSYKSIVCSVAFILISLLSTLPVAAQSVKPTRGKQPTAATTQPQRANKQGSQVKKLNKFDMATAYKIWSDWHKAQEQGIFLPSPTLDIRNADAAETKRISVIWDKARIQTYQEALRRQQEPVAKRVKDPALAGVNDPDAPELMAQSSQSFIANPMPLVPDPNARRMPGFNNQPQGIAGVLAQTFNQPQVNRANQTQPNSYDAVAANTDRIGTATHRKEVADNINKAKALADAADPSPDAVGSVTTQYLIDDNNITGMPQVVEELQNGHVVKQYSYGADGLISQRQLINGQWVTSFFIKDGQGSIRMLTDTNGNVTDTYDYDAYGNLINQTGNTPNNYLYNGEQFDPDLGFYYLRARFLNTSTGRFLTQDRFEGIKEDPLSLHKYLYVNANPINNVDPSGLLGLADVGINNSFRDVLNTFATVSFSLLNFQGSETPTNLKVLSATPLKIGDSDLDGCSTSKPLGLQISTLYQVYGKNGPLKLDGAIVEERLSNGLRIGNSGVATIDYPDMFVPLGGALVSRNPLNTGKTNSLGQFFDVPFGICAARNEGPFVTNFTQEIRLVIPGMKPISVRTHRFEIKSQFDKKTKKFINSVSNNKDIKVTDQ